MRWLVLAAPALLGLALYLPALRYGFVWDDWALVPLEVYAAGDVWRVLTTPANGVHYLPVRDLSLLLDTALFGRAAGGFHAVNALLFALGAGLVAAFYRALLARAPDWPRARTQGAAAACALLFAAHPLQVESVAFVSNRSGLLALVFALASCLAGGRWAARGGRGAWAASLAFTAAAVLSKQSAVSLPLLLAVVVLHHRPDARWREWLRPLLPHALLAAGAAVVHAAVARSAGILLAPVDSPLDALARVPRALFAAQFYVWKLVWPVELTIEYDVEGILRPSAGLLASSAAAVAAAAWLLAPARRRSLAGRLLLFYLAALLPVSNLLPTVPTVADRYAQLPLVALVPLVALPALARLPLRAAMAAVGAATVLLVGLTVRQLPVWRDDAALLAHATAVNPGAPAALGNLVFVLWEQGRHAEAMRVAHELERVRPGDFRFAYVQALAAERDGRLADAEHWLEAASRVPDARAYAVHAKLGDVYLRRGRRDDARRAYERALALAADDPLAAPYREVIQRNLRLLGGGG